MTDPLTQSKIDELHHQLDAHRKVSVQNQERMRLIIHNHKKSLEAISISNKLQLEKQARDGRRVMIGAVVLFGLLCLLFYTNQGLVNRVDHLTAQLGQMEQTTQSNLVRVESKVKGLEVEQHDTKRKLDRTRKNMGVDE